MSSYRWKCRIIQKVEIKNFKTKNGKMMLSSICVVAGRKKLRFIKEQETTKIVDNMLGTKIPVLGDIPVANILL